jgi:hypothetical protein
MEQSEKEKLLKELSIIVQKETSPILDILIAYLDVQFDIVDERIQHLSRGIVEVLEILEETRKA